MKVLDFHSSISTFRVAALQYHDEHVTTYLIPKFAAHYY